MMRSHRPTVIGSPRTRRPSSSRSKITFVLSPDIYAALVLLPLRICTRASSNDVDSPCHAPVPSLPASRATPSSLDKSAGSQSFTIAFGALQLVWVYQTRPHAYEDSKQRRFLRDSTQAGDGAWLAPTCGDVCEGGASPKIRRWRKLL
jgi:hypothetical protein